ncbi:metal ABC transporter solute-binding protein, Zn/Mn family [Bacillus seohaeanensis]|jgi:zinc transport system substrate-binding protein|uniref:Metal ABC transporter solute-binding protein, Zn/Mn family n=1 Tax=Bacillus seohaeanensis TaxID=284580 RepID=A0ABW5RV01_9BACI
MISRRLAVIFLLMLSTVISGCASGNGSKSVVTKEGDAKDTEVLKVFTTLYPLQYFASAIGGDYIDVESIIPLGADAHTFEPTTKQMVEIAESDLFIYNGLEMEPYADAIAEAIKKEEVRLVEATRGIETISHSHGEGHSHEEEGHEEEEQHVHEGEVGHGEEAHAHEEAGNGEEKHVHEEGHHHGDKDPHIWLDPYKSITLAKNIKNGLVELMPQHQKEFEENFVDLKKNLERLDEDFHKVIGDKVDPKIIVSHAAYGYWEESYGLKQIAVSGLSPSDEPSQAELLEIIEVAKANDIQYVIFEQNVTTKVAEVIRKEINAEPLRLHNLSVLTEEDSKNGDDYFSIMNKNLETLKQALQ